MEVLLTGASARTRIAERVKAVSHRLAFEITFMKVCLQNNTKKKATPKSDMSVNVFLVRGC